jgi:5-formyltetrahydrofolate cyclo-ligase
MQSEQDPIEIRNFLRRDALSKRDALSEEQRLHLSERICAKLIADLKNAHARIVHCYISFRTEVETRILIEHLLQARIRVVTPVVDVAAGPRSLVHTEIRHLRELQTGAFGLQEPIARDAADLAGLDAVIVPIVAFDRQGARLGYGKGFYDTFLRQLPAETKRIGLAFALQEVPHIPLLPHDERLGRIITESEDIITTHS